MEGLKRFNRGLERFNQGLRPPSIVCLVRNILDRYPDNGQILKELIQNAEDARATEIKFLLDETEYARKKLFSPDTAQFQGPALYAYNNAEFSDDDWEGICLLNASIKENDKHTIGCFGEGFKSVFHMTDFPGILTGTGIGFIDPHEKYLNFKNPKQKGQSCKVWDLQHSEDRAEIHQFYDQFQPFWDSTFNAKNTLKSGIFEGMTLFRFPLRLWKSELSEVIYHPDHVRMLFNALKHEAHEVLLFLKHLRTIQVYERNKDGETVKIYEVSKKIVLLNLLKEVQIQVECTHPKRTEQSRFFLQEYIADNYTLDATAIKLEDQVCALPNVGVALKLEASWLNYSSGDNIQELCISKMPGRIFCFLPLPLQPENFTGLNIHINASWSIERSRRSISLPAESEDRRKVNNPKLQWNLYIIEKLIPEAMIELSKSIAHLAKQNHGDYDMLAVNAVYSIMPNLMETVKPTWMLCANAFYQKLLYYEQNAETVINVWYCLKQADRYLPVTMNQNTLFDEWKTIDPTKICIHRIFNICSTTVILAPEHVLKALQEYRKGIKLVCNLDSLLNALKSPQITEKNLSNEDHLLLLRYVSKQARVLNLLGVSYFSTKLIGCKLLPLSNGNWITFSARGTESGLIFISSQAHPQDLLPGLDDRFVDSTVLVDPEIAPVFNYLAEKGATQVMKLTPLSAIGLLNYVPEISHEQDVVVPNSSQNLTRRYLSQLWTYLRQNAANELGKIEEMMLHLVPVSLDEHPAHLARLHKYMLINEPNVDSNLMDVCRKLGMVVVDLPGYLQDIKELVGIYILRLNPVVLVQCLKRIPDIAKILVEFDDSLKVAIRSFFGKGLQNPEMLRQLRDDDVNFLRQLPLFCTLQDSGFSSAHFESCLKVTKAVFSIETGVLVPEELFNINPYDKDSLFLADNVLRIRIMKPIELLRELVFNGVQNGVYNKQQLEQTMVAVFSEFRMFLDDPEFISHLATLRFVERLSNTYAMPCELYDSCDEKLSSLFQGQDRFPCGEFHKPDYRNLLLALGLKGRDQLTILDLVNVASEVHNDRSKTKSHVLMKVVEEWMKNMIAKNVQTKYFKKDLQKLIWVETEMLRPESYPNTFQFASGHATPSQICSSKYSNVIGSVQHTIDVNKWPNLATIFGWTKEPIPDDVVRHLQNFIEWFNNTSNPLSPICCGLDYTSIRRHCEDIYKFLEKTFESPKYPNFSKKLPALFANPCLFIETNFVPTRRCTLNQSHGQQFLPWIASIPKSMIDANKKLLECLGIKETLGVAELSEILKDVHDLKDGTELSKNEYDVVRYIIPLVGDLWDTISVKNIYLTDTNHIMRPVSMLWLEETGSITAISDSDQHVRYQCDPDIASEIIAKRLGVQSKCQQILRPHVQPLPFGQTEKLITRLKRLLQTTPFGLETFKELIQNADDAGATKIHFIFDPRTLPAVHVFEQSWKLLQGPAFCIFNDRPFSEKDLQGIQDLGEGSKDMELKKIGQYGVGFNCVYHLTDFPTILTHVNDERCLCAFDPTLSYVSIANLISPGGLYKDIEKLKSVFPDTFEGFLEKEYSSLGGTFFRLPLRLQASKISDTVKNEAEILDLFDEFKGVMEEYLLFMNNLREISLKTICSVTGDVLVLHTVTAKISPSEDFESFQMSCRTFAEDFKKSLVPRRDVSEVNYDLIIEKYSSNRPVKFESAKWKVAQRIGFDHQSKIPKNIVKLHVEEKLNVLPRGGVAYRLPALKGDVSEAFSELIQNRLYCFLPLPVQLRLPVVINGHFFLDHDSRRTLLNEEVGGQKKGWNEYLLKHIIPQAYCSLIGELKSWVNDGSINLISYLASFPDLPRDVQRVEGVLGSNATIEKTISIAFYKLISEKNVLPALRVDSSMPVSWVNSTSGHFDMQPVSRILPPNHFKKPNLSTDEQEKDRDILRNILIRSGFIIIHSSTRLCSNFKESEVRVHELTPQNVLLYYLNKEPSIFPTTISDFENTTIKPMQSVVELLKFCSNWVEFKKNLLNRPLRVTEDGLVSSFVEQDVKFISFHCKVVPHAQSKFVHHDIVKAAKFAALDQNLHLCQPFNVSAFVKLLPDLLPQSMFYGCDKEVSINDLRKCISVFEKDSALQSSWLKSVWRYLKEEVHCSYILECENSKNKTIAECDFSKKHLAPLNSWCLLPVYRQTKNGNTTSLLPLGVSEWVMLQKNAEENLHEVYKILLKLGVPFVKSEPRANMYSDKLMNFLVGNKKHPTAVSVVKGIMYLPIASVDLLTAGEKKSLLKYLSQTRGDWKAVSSAVETLRKLSLFETVTGELVALQSYKKIFFLPQESTMPRNNWQVPIHSTGTVFLNFDQETYLLLELLGCCMLSEANIYIDFIFESFSLLSSDSQYEHLKYIKDKVSQTNISAAAKQTNEISLLLAKLKTLPYLRYATSETLECAKAFYNPNVELFLLMEPADCFPKFPFRSDEWIEFHKKCGLTSEINCEILERYVNTIAISVRQHEMNNPVFRDSVVLKSKMLVDCIMARLSERSLQFCEQIKSVKFIFPKCVSPEQEILFKQYGTRDETGQLTCIAFKDSYMISSSDLVWSVGSLLPHVPNFEAAKHAAQIARLKIKIETSHNIQDAIVSHTVNICKSYLSQEPNDEIIVIELNRVLNNIYHTLQSLLPLSSDNIKTLQETRCILINDGHHLVHPEQVIFQLQSEIRPHLFRFPSALLTYHVFMTELNILQEPVFQTYVAVLKKIYSIASGKDLTTDEIASTVTAIEGLFLTSDTTISPLCPSLQQLYLPGCTVTDLQSDNMRLRLYEANKLVIRDSNDIAIERLVKYERPFLNLPHKSMNLSLNIEKMMNTLPEQYRPHLLSETVEEKLISAEKLNKTQRPSELEKKLRSVKFRKGIARLVNHNAYLNKITINMENIKANLSSLSEFHVYGMNNVRTFLADVGGTKIEGSEQSVPYFFNGMELLVNKSLINDSQNDVLNIRLGEVLNKITKYNLTNVLHFVAPILNCKVSQIEQRLDDMRARRLDTDNGEEQFFDCPADADEMNVKRNILMGYIPEQHDALTNRPVESRSRESIYMHVGTDSNDSDSNEDHSHEDVADDMYPQLSDAELAGIGKKWLAQAQCDHESAGNDIGKFDEWACYKFHQASEKALKAVLKRSGIKVDALDDRHDIVNLAHLLCTKNLDKDGTIIRLAREVNQLLRNHARMRYPFDNDEMIPHERYNKNISLEAEKATAQIVCWAENIISTQN